jgi:anti-anti-sigma factor
MKIAQQTRDGITIFSLDGRIDTEGAEELEEALRAGVTEGRYKMVLDMTQVSYISSAGLRTLASVLTQNQERDGDLKLVGLNRKVLRVLRIIGFDRFFEIYEQPEAAAAAYESS